MRLCTPGRGKAHFALKGSLCTQRGHFKPQLCHLHPKRVTSHPKGHNSAVPRVSCHQPEAAQRDGSPQKHGGVTGPAAPRGGQAASLANTAQTMPSRLLWWHSLSPWGGDSRDSPRAHLHCRGGWRCRARPSPRSPRWPRPSPRGSCPPLGRPHLPPSLPGNLWGHRQGGQEGTDKGK